jgi:hypothetical protein
MLHCMVPTSQVAASSDSRIAASWYNIEGAQLALCIMLSFA